MKKQQNVLTNEEQDKISLRNLNEMEINLLDKELKIMVIRILGRRMDEGNEIAQRDGKFKKVSNRSHRAKNIIIELKNIL